MKWHFPPFSAGGKMAEVLGVFHFHSRSRRGEWNGKRLEDTGNSKNRQEIQRSGNRNQVTPTKSTVQPQSATRQQTLYPPHHDVLMPLWYVHRPQIVS